jgi:hypothetical protein
MRKNITFVALDDSKRTIVAAMLPPGSDKPDLRSIPNGPRYLRRMVEGLSPREYIGGQSFC